MSKSLHPDENPSATSMAAAADVNALIADAARDFSDYQQLAVAGKLAEGRVKIWRAEAHTGGAASAFGEGEEALQVP